jgi:hypothetical protein
MEKVEGQLAVRMAISSDQTLLTDVISGYTQNPCPGILSAMGDSSPTDCAQGRKSRLKLSSPVALENTEQFPSIRQAAALRFRGKTRPLGGIR